MKPPHAIQGALAALLGAALLGGCATRTNYVAPDLAMPAGWQQGAASSPAPSSGALPSARNAAATRRLSPWWLEMNDPVLVKLIDQALARNNDLAQAAIKVQQARLKAGQAASNQLPSVSVQGSSSATRTHGVDGTTRSNAVSATASWELDLWGRLAALRDVADFEASATEQDRLATAMTLVGTVAADYWQVAYLNQRVEASAQSIAYAKETLKLVQAQYAAGATSRLEVAQAEQTVASQEAAHTQWLQQRVEARNALAILFDGPPGVAQDEAVRLPEGVLPGVPSGVPAAVLARRPDLVAAEQRLREALASVDATRVSYYPTLTLTGAVGGASDSLSRVLDNPYASVAGGLVLPFVQWRDMNRAVSISQADYDIAVRAYRQSWYQALADVENALSARQQYEVQGERLMASLQAAQEAERLAEVRYRSGSVALKTWLDAQETRRTAENTLAQNRLNRLNALATLYQVLGGGLQGEGG
jgi:NodT family efflux transporter outer membrane factor (OMF) lipoprotein